MIGLAARRGATTTAGLDEYSSHLDGRISAIGRAQLLSLRAPSASVDLHHLVADELLAHAAIEGKQLSISGPAVRVAGRAVSALWLAVHELAVNAIKYGALARPDGHIDVAWRLNRNGSTSVLLRWIERRGPPVASERRPGFGTDMIERQIRRDLGGTGAIHFKPTGLVCSIALPLSDEIWLADTQ